MPGGAGVRNLVPFSQMHSTPERQIAAHDVGCRGPFQLLVVDRVRDGDRRSVRVEVHDIERGQARWNCVKRPIDPCDARCGARRCDDSREERPKVPSPHEGHCQPNYYGSGNVPSSVAGSGGGLGYRGTKRAIKSSNAARNFFKNSRVP
jgi:hypothetical protein